VISKSPVAVHFLLNLAMLHLHASSAAVPELARTQALAQREYFQRTAATWTRITQITARACLAAAP